jgi:hypothetical protein
MCIYSIDSSIIQQLKTEGTHYNVDGNNSYIDWSANEEEGHTTQWTKVKRQKDKQ